MSSEQLSRRIEKGEAGIAAIGLGYVGLPDSVELASAGPRVLGVDVAASKLAAVQRGESCIRDVPLERLRLLRLLEQKGATLHYRYPRPRAHLRQRAVYFTPARRRARGYRWCAIVTDDTALDVSEIEARAPLVNDTSNATKGSKAANVHEL